MHTLRFPSAEVGEDKRYLLRMTIANSRDVYVLSEALMGISEMVANCHMAWKTARVFPEGGLKIRQYALTTPGIYPEIVRLGKGSIVIEIVVLGTIVLGLAYQLFKTREAYYRMDKSRLERDQALLQLERMARAVERSVCDSVEAQGGRRGRRVYLRRQSNARRRYLRGVLCEQETITDIHIEVEEYE